MSPLSFPLDLEDAVLIMWTITIAGPQPTVIRLLNVTPESFC